MIINKDIAKVNGVIQKQIRYLNSHHSNHYFNKNNYSFYFSPDIDIFGVRIILEEQSSGSCWSESLYEPSEYKLKISKVKKSIRVILSSVLPKTKKKYINSLVHLIFENMLIKENFEVEHYRNYTRSVSYKISITEIYNIVEEYSKKHNS